MKWVVDARWATKDRIDALNVKLIHAEKLTEEIKKIKQPIVLPNWWMMAIASICFIGFIAIAAIKIFDYEQAKVSVREELSKSFYDNFYYFRKDVYQIPKENSKTGAVILLPKEQ